MTSTNAEQRRALVTGAQGFAGTHLVAQLAAAGWDVHSVSRRSGHDLAERDAADRAVREARPDVIFHLAAIVDTVTTPSVGELIRVNVGATRELLAAAAEHAPAARFVFASSAFVYGRTSPEEQPITESQALEPLTAYGDSKVEAEHLVRRHIEEGGDAVIARAFQHTGPGHLGAYALPEWAAALAQMKLTGEHGEVLTGNLDVERDYLDVRDVTAAYLALAERGRAGETYNVASGSGVMMRLLLEGLIDAFGVEPEIVTDPARVRSVDQPSVIGDRTKLTADTDWQPRISLEDTLADLARFHLEHVQLGD